MRSPAVPDSDSALYQLPATFVIAYLPIPGANAFRHQSMARVENRADATVMPDASVTHDARASVSSNDTPEKPNFYGCEIVN